ALRRRGPAVVTSIAATTAPIEVGGDPLHRCRPRLQPPSPQMRSATIAVVVADPDWGGGGRNRGHHCRPLPPKSLNPSVDLFFFLITF
ncbi:hypothetical protein CRG98_001375, partial [Punica granatum]